MVENRKRRPTKADLERTISNQQKLIGAIWDLLPSSEKGRMSLLTDDELASTLFSALSATKSVDPNPQLTAQRLQSLLDAPELTDLTSGRSRRRKVDIVPVDPEEILALLEAKRRGGSFQKDKPTQLFPEE